MQKITLIVPVYNEEKCIEIFYNRCANVFEKLLDRVDFEILFVNNASQDQTLSIILKLIESDQRVQVITHSRNFGYQASLFSGLTHATGDGFFIIDVDCEDPPEMLLQFIPHFEAGYDLVYGERVSREEFFLVSWIRKLFYRLTHAIADWEFVKDMAEFSLISNRMRLEVLKTESSFPFVRSSFGYIGFNKLGVPYKRSARVAGSTHYNLVRMSQFAIAGILSASTFPLRFIGYLGALLLLFNLGSFFFIEHPLVNLVGEKINSLFNIFAFMFVASYIARIYKDSAKRKIFIIDEKKSVIHKQPSTGEGK